MVAANPAAGGGAPDPEDIVALPTNADKGTFKKVVFPLHSDTTGHPWASTCLQKAQDAAELRALRVLNGMRVTVWQICVEKRRQYLSSMLGLGSPMTPMPPDCCRKILEFLPVICADYAGHKWAEMIHKTFCNCDQKRIDFSGSGATARVVLKTNERFSITLADSYPLAHQAFVAMNRRRWWEVGDFIRPLLASGYGYHLPRFAYGRRPNQTENP